MPQILLALTINMGKWANGLPNTALQEICKCVLRFDDRATVSTLHGELYSLAFQWESLEKSPLEDYIVSTGREVTQTIEEDTGLSYIEFLAKT